MLAAIDEIRNAIDNAPTLDELAQLTGYSPAHFQRLFKRSTGLSPAAYARALREERARDALSGGESVTEAIYEAGYSTPSRFYAGHKEKMGMAPSAWANGGKGVTIHWAAAPTSLGPMLVAATDKGVCRLSFGENQRELARRFPNATLVEGGAEFEKLLAEVVAGVEQPGDSRISLDVKGTAFQEACGKPCAKSSGERAPMPKSPRRPATSGRSAPRGAQCAQQCRGADPLPPGDPHRRRPRRLRYASISSANCSGGRAGERSKGYTKVTLNGRLKLSPNKIESEG